LNLRSNIILNRLVFISFFLNSSSAFTSIFTSSNNLSEKIKVNNKKYYR